MEKKVSKNKKRRYEIRTRDKNNKSKRKAMDEKDKNIEKGTRKEKGSPKKTKDRKYQDEERKANKT